MVLKNDLDSGLGRGEGAGEPVLGNKVTNPETREWHGHSLFILFSFCIELWYLTWSYEKERIWLSWSAELAGVAVADSGNHEVRKSLEGRLPRVWRSEFHPEPWVEPSALVDGSCSLLLEGRRSSGQQSRDHASGKNSPSEPRSLLWMPRKRKGIYRDRKRGSPSPWELCGMFAPDTLHWVEHQWAAVSETEGSRDNWAINLWWGGVELIKTRLPSIVEERGCRKPCEGVWGSDSSERTSGLARQMEIKSKWVWEVGAAEGSPGWFSHPGTDDCAPRPASPRAPEVTRSCSSPW